MKFKFLTSIVANQIFVWIDMNNIDSGSQAIIAAMFLIAALYFMENKK